MERKNQRLRTSYRCHPERSAAESKDLVEVAATRRGLPRPLIYSLLLSNYSLPIKAVGRTQNYPQAKRYPKLPNPPINNSKISIFQKDNFLKILKFKQKYISLQSI